MINSRTTKIHQHINSDLEVRLDLRRPPWFGDDPARSRDWLDLATPGGDSENCRDIQVCPAQVDVFRSQGGFLRSVVGELSATKSMWERCPTPRRGAAFSALPRGLIMFSEDFPAQTKTRRFFPEQHQRKMKKASLSPQEPRRNV